MALFPDIDGNEESMYESVLDDNDPFLSHDPSDQFQDSSPYIEEGNLNDFYKFHGASAINLIHIL